MVPTLVILAFILVMVGVAVQCLHGDYEVRTTVAWFTAIAALVFLIFAGKIHFG